MRVANDKAFIAPVRRCTIVVVGCHVAGGKWRWNILRSTCFDYGDPGAGKSEFASTFPKPIIVFQFDPYGKDTPYLRRGRPTDFTFDHLGTPVRQIMSRKTGALLIQIEYFHDTDWVMDAKGQGANQTVLNIAHVNPECWERFGKRMYYFSHEEYAQWATAVFDSVTTMEIAARAFFQYKINPNAKDGRQWWGEATSALEQILYTRVGGFPMNVVTLAHVDKEQDEVLGVRVRNPLAPGRLRGSLGGAYGEFYHHFVSQARDVNNRPAGEREYLVQTQGSSQWNASSQIHAPDPCPSTYQALWTGEEAA